MKIATLTPDVSGLVDWPLLSRNKKAVVTVGTFDGMHRGHQAVVRRVVELARETDSFAVAVMFDRRPAMVHGYAAAHDGAEPPADLRDTQALTSVRQRLRMLDHMGVDHALVVHYDCAFAAKSFRFFLGQLVGRLGMRTLVLGSDATMGAGRTGDIKAIQALADSTGVFELDVVDDLGPGHVRVPARIDPVAPPADKPGEPADPRENMNKAELRAWSKANQGHEVRVWSSSNVRYLLSRGCVKAANEVLGYAHAVEGEVVHGEQRGRTIGFPTANLTTDVEGYVPVDGVYAGWLVDLGPVEQKASDDSHSGGFDTIGFDRDRARMATGSQWRWPAAISIGTKPTYSDETGIADRVIEPYCVTPDWLELYGHRVRVEFAGFLRPQIKFSGTDELKAALKDYAEQTLAMTRKD
ncbi:riboflavin kinase / FMN adenylyltransferase [Bifidobacterium bohemicum]|uniref:Riboflavin biosynthesis protein RibF n=1 Tax=Bifidobacterium bohemicum DSM 22767 TaxID=1437606 RepID=A0A086ZEF5_9BIFI|nr:riboflavin kinase [Bifidobacterium bohemicum]KFI44905.1 riboflavin biosynthesis protein RibF [Bifidobacterium bohemicum DSM 22767]SCB96961.1 riboflavin kinase / FMN adenylyltransferase [Bifidobacterium bohemicum]